uniref:F-box domain-containing protein n=1 Tax=Panagrolaimus davidi TaxID=227884 RepID=A0A914PKG7_9BILA
MFHSKEFYDRCCPPYKKVIDKLDEKLAGMKDQKEVRDTIIEFSRHYLIPKEYWNRCFEHVGQYDENDPHCKIWEKLCRKTAKHAFFHLHYDKEKWSELCLTRNNLPPLDFYLNLYHGKNVKLIDYQHYSLYAGERDIGYPHDNLEDCFSEFEEVASSIPSKKVIKRYEEMKDLYHKIKAAEDNVDEWFKLLLAVEDVDFVKDNVELRLGKDYFDVQLWKLYIGFLKQKGEYKRLIQTYSKYCRFFLDDHEMLKKYKNDMSEYGPMNLLWYNFYEFEVQNGVEEAEEIISVEPEAVLPFDSNICSRFYDTYFLLQLFSLPRPIILYILENANDRVLRQLFSTCKYFFVKKPTPICYRFITGSRTWFNNEMLTLVDSANPNLYLKNTYITGSIVICVSNTSFISSLIPRLSCCEAKYIEIYGQPLSFDELKFLIQHGGVIDLNMRCEMKDANGDYIDVEKIMAFLPNIQGFFMRGIKVNADTGHALSNMKFNAKLSSFGIWETRGKPFDSNEFLKYCIANKAERLFLSFIFDEEFDADFVENFGEILSDYTKSNENVSLTLLHGGVTIYVDDF